MTFKFENVDIAAKKNVRVAIYGTGHFHPHNFGHKINVMILKISNGF